MAHGPQELAWIDKLPHNLTVSEVAEVIRTSVKTVRRRIEQGRLRACKLTEGGSARVLVPREEIRRLFTEAGAPTSCPRT